MAGTEDRFTVRQHYAHSIIRFASGFAKAAVLKAGRRPSCGLSSTRSAPASNRRRAARSAGVTAREVALARSWRCIHAGGMEASEHVIDAETRAQILDAALRRVIERYVDPDVAAKMEAAVRARIDAGEYDGIASGTEL